MTGEDSRDDDDQENSKRHLHNKDKRKDKDRRSRSSRHSRRQGKEKDKKRDKDKRRYRYHSRNSGGSRNPIIIGDAEDKNKNDKGDNNSRSSVTAPPLPSRERTIRKPLSMLSVCV